MSNNLAQRFESIRQQTLALAKPLSEADMTIQAADFASPGKWHLAHTTWFFEEFFLKQPGLNPKPQLWPQSDTYRFLFNSYYETIGHRQAQGKRGLITRPDLAEVLAYRHAVDQSVIAALRLGINDEQAEIIELGLYHEQQHQELFLTDILYNLAQNPILPAYQVKTAGTSEHPALDSPGKKSSMVAFEGGLVLTGHDGNGFGFDNEFPQHKVYLEPFLLASTLVTNEDWIAFIEDGGYRNPLLWLSDGWKTVQTEGWQMPLYWQREDDYRCMSLAGLQPVSMKAPVCHISFFEADAFARWSGKRLPTEVEWELAALPQPITGNFAESGQYSPQAIVSDASQQDSNPVKQLFGDVWEWTASPYVAYPGFKTRPGAVGEYNGKFMNGQYVLRGGSCVTPASHIRASYRNFFYPHQRWQFSGLRLADNAS
ncbi:MAG TPA: ergothioneine biosynthesis protein EgtB [Methylophilaceae bacterium]|nr:ergothioneine biosynthesis protein EgtB [Methylophilaceae bacterium]